MPSTYQRLRELVAARRARRSVAALKEMTRAYDRRASGDPIEYSDDTWRGGFAPIIRGGYVATFPTQAERDAAVQCRDHPRHSLARAERIREPYGLDAADVAYFRAELSVNAGTVAMHRTVCPDLYAAPMFDPRPSHASDVQVMSTDYVREVTHGEDETGQPVREVRWVPASDPMADALRNGRPTRDVLMLERAADALIRAADAADHHDACIDALSASGTVAADAVPDRPRMVRVDVLDRYTRRPTVAPDRVAFRGVQRYVRPSPVRYHVAKPARVLMFPGDYAASDRTLETGNLLGSPIGETTFTLYRTDVIGANVAMIGCAGPRPWQGFKITTGETARMARKLSKRRNVTAIKRGDATGKRGKAVNAWNLADRSLPRAWSRADAGQHAAAELLETLLISSTRGTPVPIGEDHPWYVVTDDASAYVATADGAPVSPAFTFRALSRRAALARYDVA